MKKFFQKIKPAYFIIILLTLISQRICYNEIVFPRAEWRMEMQETILTNQASTPYQYRILKPVTGKAVQILLSPVVKNDVSRHLLSYKIILYVVFFSIYLFFYLYLRYFYSDVSSIIGLLLLQILIPLSLTNQWQEGDFITLMFYMISFWSFVKKKDLLIPLIIFIGTFNRDQVIYILAFYIVWLFSEKRLFTLKSLIIISAGILLFIAAYFGVRFYFGFKPVIHTFAQNSSINLEHWTSIVRLWIEQVLIFVILSVISYKKSTDFFRYSFLLIIPYTVLFFFNGIMSELAKYLPAFTVMIMISIQLFNNEFTRNRHAG